MKLKNIFIFILIFHLLVPGLAYSFSLSDLTGCKTKNSTDTYTRLCHSVDDILCKDTPDRLRRSCDERDQTIVHADMSANEVYNFAKDCFKSSVHSFVSFFTEFLPDLCKSIWDISKKMYQSASSPGFFASVKGAYESARSVAADTYEAVKKNPGAFFNNIWNKIGDAVAPMIIDYDCLNPHAKVEKICGTVTMFLMPPSKLAAIIVRGASATRALVALNLFDKFGKKKAGEILKIFDSRPKFTYKQYRLLYKQHKELGYTLEDFKLMRLNGTLGKIEFDKLKPLTTPEGIEQYKLLTGRDFPEARLLSKEKILEKKAPAPSPSLKKSSISSSSLDTYKKRYAKDLELKAGANNDFIRLVEADTHNPTSKTLYFDVENSIQKKLNDSVFVDKGAVDAINNSFFQKFNSNLHDNPELMSRLEGEYKDYKSYRLRLSLKPGDDAQKYESLLNDLYKKSNEEFALELSRRKISKLIPPRNDGVNDTASWFLSGAGENSLEANMAARASRAMERVPGRKGSSLSLFRDHADVLHRELNEIEKLRAGLSGNKALLEGKVIEQIAPGKAIPSKSMISILRKIKPAEFNTPEEYIAKIQSKGKEIFGVNLDEQTVKDLTNYFSKVDSMSPPLFSAERVIVDLGKAKNGIVSIDFAGIGVDNIYQQMKGLSEVSLKNADPKTVLQSSFQKMQSGVDEVSKEMEKAKISFSKGVSTVEGHDKNSPLFSGDDGIHMPLDKVWGEKEKVKLVQDLASTEDPSKFRVTFVSTHFPDGKIIPATERSEKIVRAETVEKDVRAKIIGVEKISEANSKNFITAIDYIPHENGGVFNLIVGGKDFSPSEMELIKHSFESVLSSESGETVGKIIFKKKLP